MDEGHQPICVKQILVSLDSSTHSFAALKAAAQLAHHFNVRLKGIFIHDSKLLNLAKSPFTQEIGEYSAISRQITTDEISSGMIVQSRWITKSFHKTIGQIGLDGTFSTFHGKINEVINQQSKSCDLIVIGKTGTHPIGRPRLGSTAKALIKTGNKPLLLVEEGTRLGFPLFVLFEDSHLGWISLQTSKTFLQAGEDINIIVVMEDISKELPGIKKRIREWADHNKVKSRLHPIKIESINRFLEKIFQLQTGLLILPKSEKPINSAVINKCILKVRLPVLLIKSQGEKEA